MPDSRLEAFSFAEKALQEGYERTAEYQGEAFLNVGSVGISEGDFSPGASTQPSCRNQLPSVTFRHSPAGVQIMAKCYGSEQ